MTCDKLDNSNLFVHCMRMRSVDNSRTVTDYRGADIMQQPPYALTADGGCAILDK